MRHFFRSFKQKIQRQSRWSERHSPQIIQMVNRKLHARMHDLDYLQWMQQNSIRYAAGICVLAVLLSVALMRQQNTDIADRGTAAQEPIAAAVQYEEPKEQNDSYHDAAASQTEEADTQEHAEVAAPQEEKTEDKTVYINPLHLSGYQAPSSGILQYNYGLGYDAEYDDYRVHHEICYGAGDGAVYACVDGTIAAVQMDQHWQVAIQTNRGTIWYAGLQTCDVADGTAVTAGQPIGTAVDKLYIQAVKNK